MSLKWISNPQPILFFTFLVARRALNLNSNFSINRNHNTTNKWSISIDKFRSHILYGLFMPSNSLQRSATFRCSLCVIDKNELVPFIFLQARALPLLIRKMNAMIKNVKLTWFPRSIYAAQPEKPLNRWNAAKIRGNPERAAVSVSYGPSALASTKPQTSIFLPISIAISEKWRINVAGNVIVIYLVPAPGWKM